MQKGRTMTILAKKALAYDALEAEVTLIAVHARLEQNIELLCLP